jgi:hypothetical protein
MKIGAVAFCAAFAIAATASAGAQQLFWTVTAGPEIPVQTPPPNYAGEGYYGFAGCSVTIGWQQTVRTGGRFGRFGPCSGRRFRPRLRPRPIPVPVPYLQSRLRPYHR